MAARSSQRTGPSQGLQHWGADASATTVSNAPALQIRAIVLLRITLVGINGTRHQTVVRVRVVRRGCASQWRGLILGAPFCDTPPIGAGHVPCLGGHYFKAFQAHDSAPRG